MGGTKSSQGLIKNTMAPGKVSRKTKIDDEKLFTSIDSATHVEDITVKNYICFAIVALLVQLVPFYYLHFVLDVYIKEYYIFLPLVLILGAGLLAYSYGVGALSYGKKHMDNSKTLTNAEFKSEAIRYSMTICNLSYLGLFLFFQWLITFRRLYTKITTVIGLSGAVTSIIASR